MRSGRRKDVPGAVLLAMSAVSHGNHVLYRTPPLATLCGSVAGAVGMATSWPQAWRLWVERRHAGLSLTANTLGVLFSIAWLLYGIASHSTVQVVTSTAGLVGAAVVLAGHLCRAGIRTVAWLPMFALGLIPVAAALACGRTVLGLTASLATVCGVVPQVIVLARARRAGLADAGGVSQSRWLLSFGCNALWVGYGVVAGDLLIAGNSTIIAALAVLVVGLARTRRPKVAAAASPTLLDSAVLEAA